MHLITIIQGNPRKRQELQRAANELGMAVSFVAWDELAISIAHQREVVARLESADAVLLWLMKLGSFEQIIFRMDVMQRVETSGVPVINPPRAIEIGVDKYLSLSLMQEAKLPVPDTVVCQRYSEGMQAFDQLGGDVVVKPIFGAQGFGMTRITDRALAQRAFTQLEQMRSVAYIQRYIAHDGTDYRLFVLGNRVIASMRRRSIDWRTNISRGGRGEPFEPIGQWCDMALCAARTCKSLVAGVDILVDDDGRPYVLEVNPVPGWKELAAVSGVDITSELLTFIATYASDRHVHA